MFNITQVKISYSENASIRRAMKCYDLSNPAKVIELLEDADREICRRNAKEGLGGYDKTDVTILWENGDSYTMRYDLGDGISISDRLNPTKELAKWIATRGENVPESLRQALEERIEYLANKAITV